MVDPLPVDRPPIAQLQNFEDQVDPEGVLDPVEKAERADFAYRAHTKRLALRSAKARRLRAQSGGEAS